MAVGFPEFRQRAAFRSIPRICCYCRDYAYSHDTDARRLLPTRFDSGCINRPAEKINTSSSRYRMYFTLLYCGIFVTNYVH